MTYRLAKTLQNRVYEQVQQGYQQLRMKLKQNGRQADKRNRIKPARLPH